MSLQCKELFAFSPYKIKYELTGVCFNYYQPTRRFTVLYFLMFVIIDLETNGLFANDSILQIAVLEVSNKVEKIFNRFYYPKEDFNPEAIKINQLSKDKIDFYRKKYNADYPKYFDDDVQFIKYLKNLLKNNVLVAFNVSFEANFLNYRGIRVKKFIDMMKIYTRICKIEHPYYGYKYPKLIEAVFKCVDNVPLETLDLFHNALIDAYFTYKLFKLYPYLEEFDRKWEFELEFHKELFKDYPIEFWLKERFRTFHKKNYFKRKYFKTFLHCLENSKEIWFILWKKIKIWRRYFHDYIEVEHVLKNNKSVKVLDSNQKNKLLRIFHYFLNFDNVWLSEPSDYKGNKSKLFNLGWSFLIWFKGCN